MKTLVKIRDDYGNALTIGELFDEVFTTIRKRSKHFFVKHGGWAIDKKVAEGVQATDFVLIDTENNKCYTISKADFLKHAEPIVNMGHREQLVVKEEFWAVVSTADLEVRKEELRKAYKGE